MAQLKDSVITGSLRVTDTTYTNDLVVNASKTARYALIAPTSDGAPTWRALTNADVGLGNVENTKLSTWAGTNKITTLGTIGTGTWNATIIGTTYGGTGVNSSSTAINKVFASPGSGNAGAPSFRSLVAADIPNLNTSKITDGTLAVARGGTNKSSWTKGGIIYASDTTTLGQIADGSADKVLRATASATYSWLSYTSENTASTIVYRNASGNFSAGTISASITFPNNTWNTVGDDVYIGDCNTAGCLGIKGKNGLSGIIFQPYTSGKTVTGKLWLNDTATNGEIDTDRDFWVTVDAARTISCGSYRKSGVSVACHINDGGTNHGIYSWGYSDGTTYTSNGKWLIYRDNTGAVICNGNANTATTATSLLDRTGLTKGTNPSATTYGLGSFALETGTGTATKNRLMGLEGNINTSGRSTINLIAYQYAAASTTTNVFSVYINADGSRGYSVSDKAAFRSAIGAGTSSLAIGTTSSTAMAGNTTVTDVKAETTTSGSWRKIMLSNNTYNAFDTDVTNVTGLLYMAKAVSVQPSTGSIKATKVYNAVWNDYAECRAAETEEPGYCVTETKEGIMIKTIKRLQAGCKVTSDTFGTCMGETEKAKTPIAVAGRVLVYPYRDRSEYSLGAAVCSAPNGTVDIMTRDEIMMYPERIVGTVSEIPDYEYWKGGDNEIPTDIKVNNRIWIYVH